MLIEDIAHNKISQLKDQRRRHERTCSVVAHVRHPRRHSALLPSSALNLLIRIFHPTPSRSSIAFSPFPTSHRMGNELSTLGGAVVTAGTAVAAGATFGQVQALNDAVVDSAKFTAEHAEKTVVRHVGETVAMALATVGTSIASGVTFGQVRVLNDAVVHCANKTAEAGERAGAELLGVADGMTDGIPVVGHVKGGVLRAIGDHERSDRALKSSSRSVSVLAGGVKGYLVGGPVGAVVGGVMCGAAMDGTITGIESALHKEFRPHGQIACWDQVAKAKSSDERIGGIVGGVMTPVADALTGFAVGKSVHMLHRPRGGNLAKIENTGGELPAATAFKRWTSFSGTSVSSASAPQVCDGLVTQAMNGVGGLVAGGKTAEVLFETASSDISMEAFQSLWGRVFEKATDAFAQRPVGEPMRMSDDLGHAPRESASPALLDLLERVRDAFAQRQAAVPERREKNSETDSVCSGDVTPPSLFKNETFKGKELLLLLLMLYVAMSSAILLTSKTP